MNHPFQRLYYIFKIEGSNNKLRHDNQASTAPTMTFRLGRFTFHVIVADVTSVRVAVKTCDWANRLS